MAAKRSIDLAIAAALFLPALLICVLILLAIRVESPGNPLFRQWRIGRDRRPFLLLKLRTMARGTAHLPSHEVDTDYITPLGRLLRRTKLDELPQIWNVLVGDMSFVGPRPCLPSQNELIEERERHGALRIRPGITGPAQLAGVDMSQPALLAWIDSEYAAHISFLQDMRILARTVLGAGRGDAASGG
jgi:lipopolysaccharide/colanic/teichoic acid biosynthesis glycosyltransferase